MLPSPVPFPTHRPDSERPGWPLPIVASSCSRTPLRAEAKLILGPVLSTDVHSRGQDSKRSSLPISYGTEWTTAGSFQMPTLEDSAFTSKSHFYFELQEETDKLLWIEPQISSKQNVLQKVSREMENVFVVQYVLRIFLMTKILIGLYYIFMSLKQSKKCFLVYSLFSLQVFSLPADQKGSLPWPPPL